MKAWWHDATDETHELPAWLFWPVVVTLCVLSTLVS